VTLKSGLEITQVIETGTIRKLESLGVVSYSPSRPNCGSIWHYFQDKARYLSKIVIFLYPVALEAPVRRSSSEYCHPVWYTGKLERWGYPWVKNSLRICITV